MSASILFAIGLPGCSVAGFTSPAIYAHAPTPAAPVSDGMRMAAPGYGGPSDASRPAPAAVMGLGPLRMTADFVALPSTPLVTPEAILTEHEPKTAAKATRFDLTGGVDFDPFGPNFWALSPELQTVAAQLSASRLTRPYEETRSFGAQFNFEAPASTTGLGFDVGFSPRAGYRREGEFEVRSFGAEFRFGPDINLRGDGAAAKSWYVFAGADGEALMWDAGSRGLGFELGSDLRLYDQVTVGDLQAGVAIQRFGGQFSLSYIRRQVEWFDANGQGVSLTEDFGGVSFALRR
ncbi:MAG: lipid A-modifier LpxR family protein [Pseudomonadota bacterium]